MIRTLKYRLFTVAIQVEIKELRAHQYQAETSLREIQLNMSTKEERYQVLFIDIDFNKFKSQ